MLRRGCVIFRVPTFEDVLLVDHKGTNQLEGSPNSTLAHSHPRSGFVGPFSRSRVRQILFQHMPACLVLRIPFWLPSKGNQKDANSLTQKTATKQVHLVRPLPEVDQKGTTKGLKVARLAEPSSVRNGSHVDGCGIHPTHHFKTPFFPDSIPM